MATSIKGKAFVPEISDERLHELLRRFTPLVLVDGKLHRIEQVDPRTIAFAWDPVLLDEVVVTTEVSRIRTNHYCAYYGFFKPSIAEVLAQIPPQVEEKANAFYIVTDADDRSPDEIAIYENGSGHRATTVFVAIPTTLAAE